MNTAFDSFRQHLLLVPTLGAGLTFVFLTAGCPAEGAKTPNGAAGRASASASEAGQPAFGLAEPEDVTPADHDIEVPPAP